MAETRTLTDHEDIRNWAAARAGRPAMRAAVPSIGNDEPVLLIVFGQQAHQDHDEGADRVATESLELVEWDEWFGLFDERRLALVVGEEVPGQRDEFHELVRRG